MIGTINISAILSTAKVEVDENSPETVICRISFDGNNQSKEVFNLEWFDQNGSFVSTSQTDGDRQIIYSGTFVEEGAAYLFVSGKDDFLKQATKQL